VEDDDGLATRHTDSRQTKQLSCLPRAQSQTSTQYTGHFDALDLARRLEAHQAQCIEAYRLHQPKIKQRESQKSRDDQANDEESTQTLAEAGSTRKERHKNGKENDGAVTISGTGPDLMIKNLRLLPQMKQSGGSRHQRSRSRRSARKTTIGRTYNDQSQGARASSHTLRDKAQQIPQHPGNECQRQLAKEGSTRTSVGKAQPFKIYNQEVCMGSRPRAVAMNVSETTRYSRGRSLINGSFEPKNAASGLAKTTAQRIEDRGLLSKQWSWVLPSSREGNVEFLRATSKSMSKEVPTVRATPFRKELPHSKQETNGKKPKAKFSREIGNFEGSRCMILQDTAGLTAQRPLGLNDVDGSPTANEDLRESKHQRRTLRAKISNMKLLGRRGPDEEAVPPKEEPVTKAAFSRRKSMLMMFRSA
jgi:hypothetical protein